VNTEVTVGVLARHNFRHRQTRDQLRWFELYRKHPVRAAGATAFRLRG
jgi:hypothetical protein